MSSGEFSVHLALTVGNSFPQRVTTFSQDAISLAVGEELRCGEKLNIFSALRREFWKWLNVLDDSGLKCTYIPLPFGPTPSGSRAPKHNICLRLVVNSRLEKEVEEYEERYRGRELPGFINYKTFESMVKEQIKQLEEPAVKRLKDIGGIC